MTQHAISSDLRASDYLDLYRGGQRYSLPISELDARISKTPTGATVMPNILTSTVLDPNDVLSVHRGGQIIELPVSELDARIAAAITDPIQLGSKLGYFIDPNRPYTMEFRPGRQFVGGNSQSCSRPGTGGNGTGVEDEQHWINGSYSKFIVSFFLRWDYDTLAAFQAAGAQYFMGKWTTDSSSNRSWLLSGSTNGATAALNLLVGYNSADGTAGAFRNSVSWNSAFLTGGGNFKNRCPMHIVLMYDGSQATDALKAQLYVDGVQQTQVTSSGALAAKLGNPSGTTKSPFFIGGITGSGFSSFSIWDVAFAAGVPSNYASAVADLYNNGEGLSYPAWPSSCPSLTRWYKCDDGASANGTAPSGNMLDAVSVAGGNNTTITNNTLTVSASPPGGVMMVKSWRDLSASSVQHRFGYSPVTNKRQRVHEGEYFPTIRGGKPGILVRGQRANGDIGNGFAYGTGAFSDAFGDGGSVFFAGMATQAIANGHNAISFCDDVTNRNNGSHGIRRAWGPTLFGVNHSLKACNNRFFPSLQINDTVDGSATASGLPADFQGFNGNENLGLAFGSQLITACVNGTSNRPRLTVPGHGFTENQWVSVCIDSGSGVTGVAGDWQVHVVDANTFELQGATFGGTFTAGDGSTNSWSFVLDKATADITVPGLNTPFSFECTNTNDGSDYWSNFTTFNTAGVYPKPGPFKFYCGTLSVPFYLDTGQATIAGHAWSTWFNDSSTVSPTSTIHAAAGAAKLTSVVINGLSEVASGAQQVSGVNDFVYGPCAVTGILTDDQRTALRNWFAVN